MYEISGIHYLSPLILLAVVVVPIVLLVILVVMLVRGSSNRSAPAQPSAGPPPPSMDQRRAGLERSRSRYREERSRILGMVKNGKVTPEEGDRLFQALERETSTMACPYCGGDVRIEAIRCKHCHHDLVEGVNQPRRLTRSRDKVLAGVCAGVAEYTGVDPSMMRLLAVLLVLVTSILPGLIVYVVAAMIMPDPE